VYSLNIGLVHWIFLSAYADTTPGSQSLGWLQRDLATYDREATPWLVVAWHACAARPCSCSALPSSAYMHIVLPTQAWPAG
jgi:hypothetical protein